MPSKIMFPQSCVSSVIKSCWPPKSDSLGFSVPLPDPQVEKSAVGPRIFLTVREFLLDNCSAVCGSSAQWLGLMVTSSKRAYAIGCLIQNSCIQSPCPCNRPLLTCTPTGYIQTQVWLSLCLFSGSCCAQVLFESSKHLWLVWGLILNVIFSLLQSCWGLSFALNMGYIFLV